MMELFYVSDAAPQHELKQTVKSNEHVITTNQKRWNNFDDNVFNIFDEWQMAGNKTS